MCSFKYISKNTKILCVETISAYNWTKFMLVAKSCLSSQTKLKKKKKFMYLQREVRTFTPKQDQLTHIVTKICLHLFSWHLTGDGLIKVIDHLSTTLVQAAITLEIHQKCYCSIHHKGKKQPRQFREYITLVV